MWKIFDKIFILLHKFDLNMEKYILPIKKILLGKYNFEDFNNVEFIQLNVNNPVIKEIWNYQIKHRLIYNYFNSRMESDFFGFPDYESSIRKIDLLKRCILLNYKRILILEHPFFGGISKNFLNNIKNIPINSYDILFFKYVKTDVINFIQYDSNWSDITYSILDKVWAYALSQNSMNHIINNFNMIPKRFCWYLYEHIMPYDYNIKRLAVNNI